MRRLAGGIALAVFVSGVSARPALRPPIHASRDYIWRHACYDKACLPATAYGFPYTPLEPADVEAGMQAQAIKQRQKEGKSDKGAKVQARDSELLAQQERHKATAAEMTAEAKSAAAKKHLKAVVTQLPPDAPEEWAQEETPERAAAPWPPHEEAHGEAAPQTPEAPAKEHAEAEEAGSGASRAEPGPSAQGKAPEETNKTETRAKPNSFYVSKCKKMFAGLDFDGDDAIEEEEVYAFFDAAWQGHDPAELTLKFLTEADYDHNRQVSTAEWDAFAAEAQRSSRGKEEWWDPLEHLKRVVSTDSGSTGEDHHGPYSEMITTRLFRVMDADGNDVASKAEMQAFLARKYPTKDPAEFSERVLVEADVDHDGNVAMSEFMQFAAGSREKSTNRQEKWNPLLHIIGTVRRNPALYASRGH